MHAMFFGVKRVHLRTLCLSRALMGPKAKLTPARFDMMRIIELHKHGAPQGKIQYLLGVSAATVSRMLNSLEDLGLVVRKRTMRDARRVLVHTTGPGRQVIREALAALIHSGVAERFALLAFGSKQPRARRAMGVLQRYLTNIRAQYIDPTPYKHPWFAADLVPFVTTAWSTLLDASATHGAVAPP